MVVGDPYYRYWGKSNSENEKGVHLLVYHSLDVAAVGNRVLFHHPVESDRIAEALSLSQEDAIRFVSFLLAIHDLGKWSEVFQGLVPDLFLRINGRKSRLDYLLRH